MTKQQLPDWFKAPISSEGDICKNPFSGNKYELNQ